MPAKDVPVFRKNEAQQGLIEQISSGYAQQVGSRDVRFANGPVLVKGEIAHRRQIVEVAIPLPRGVKLALDAAQLVFLHLQLDLLHLQLTDQPFPFRSGQRFRGRGWACSNTSLCRAAEVGEIIWRNLRLRHGLASPFFRAMSSAFK